MILKRNTDYLPKPLVYKFKLFYEELSKDNSTMGAVLSKAVFHSREFLNNMEFLVHRTPEREWGCHCCNRAMRWRSANHEWSPSERCYGYDPKSSGNPNKRVMHDRMIILTAEERADMYNVRRAPQAIDGQVCTKCYAFYKKNCNFRIT